MLQKKSHFGEFPDILQRTSGRIIKKHGIVSVETLSPQPEQQGKLSKANKTAFVLSVKCNPKESFTYHQNALF